MTDNTNQALPGEWMMFPGNKNSDLAKGASRFYDKYERDPQYIALHAPLIPDEPRETSGHSAFILDIYYRKTVPPGQIWLRVK